MVKTRSARGGNSSQPLGRGQVPSNLPPHPPPPIPNTFPPVDHVEGEDENQPHNSISNSASTANQDVVATQLAAMQQQFGVFQQVLAQLLARNNPGDPLINLLNLAPPQPPAPPQNPEPVQRAPAVSESQGQSHIAPVQQPPHDDVTRRLDSLERLVVEQRGAPPPYPAVDSVPHPLNTNIVLKPYPTGFRIPQLETYDGTKDPDDHLHAFYSCMQAQNASDALMCKIFPSTLRGNAQTWYYSLLPRSINSYTELASAFVTKFSSKRLIRKPTSELMRVKQRDGESLKNFMSRFNDAVLEVNSFDQAVGITAVISGLGHERFRDSLLKHPANTFSEVNDRSLKFITAEEYALSQNLTPTKSQHPDWRDENPNRKRMKTTQNRGPMSTPRFRRPNSSPPQQLAGKPPVNSTPFNLPRSQIFMQIKNKMDLRRPGPMRTAAATRDHTRYCDFHQDHGHTTEQCNSLRSKLESLAQKGMLNEYIQRVEQPRFVREQGSQHQAIRNPPNRQGVGYQQAPPPLPPPARVIHMITGGLEAGGLSSKQRKLYVREVKHQNQAQKRKFDDAEWKKQPITFTSADLETVVTPHNDPLVTFVTINNCEVQRVLVDTGSAPDIMYFHCFESLGLDPILLQRYGILNQIVAYNGTQFNCTSFRDFCSSYGIKLQFTSVYHPESNGMVESVNKCILEGIKPRLEQHKAKWADELNNVLWAYRTTSRTTTGETPYHLAFGTEAVIPIEIGVPSFRVTHFDEGRNGQLLRENLDLLDDLREKARLRTLVYKQKIANFYNKRVRPRSFKVGDLVLRKTGLMGFETRFGKLAPNWEGLYTVAKVPHPGAYILRDTEGKRVPRVWNINNLKKFYP
ncbi:hypothetical protein SLEP1_g16680 [Rubroshorea leprosula]|uniref:Integrase catalytic domain-containing protein n=1 Tax=Rubroshorea leprosula TaxID=152421 RepID=A0AAV5J0P9_9ROSI|nr:hypothetical protein SLEP1_g16680 [Rubroshorea leprosula]